MITKPTTSQLSTAVIDRVDTPVIEKTTTETFTKEQISINLRFLNDRVKAFAEGLAQAQADLDAAQADLDSFESDVQVNPPVEIKP